MALIIDHVPFFKFLIINDHVSQSSVSDDARDRYYSLKVERTTIAFDCF